MPRIITDKVITVCNNDTTQPKQIPLLNRLLSFLLLAIRPFIGPVYCSFEVGCTTYAILQLATKPLFPALWAISKRLIACCL